MDIIQKLQTKIYLMDKVVWIPTETVLSNRLQGSTIKFVVSKLKIQTKSTEVGRCYKNTRILSCDFWIL
jgi:hypothetical protein